MCIYLKTDSNNKSIHLYIATPSIYSLPNVAPLNHPLIKMETCRYGYIAWLRVMLSKVVNYIFKRSQLVQYNYAYKVSTKVYSFLLLTSTSMDWTIYMLYSNTFLPLHTMQVTQPIPEKGKSHLGNCCFVKHPSPACSKNTENLLQLLSECMFKNYLGD